MQSLYQLSKFDLFVYVCGWILITGIIGGIISTVVFASLNYYHRTHPKNYISGDMDNFKLMIYDADDHVQLKYIQDYIEDYFSKIEDETLLKHRFNIMRILEARKEALRPKVFTKNTYMPVTR